MATKKEMEKAQEKKEYEIRSTYIPRRDYLEMFALVTKLHGTDQIKTTGEDGEERMCRIPGKLRKKVWIREGDVVVIRLWDFQRSKADIVWRYTGTQVEHLRRKGYLSKLPL